MKDYSKNTLQIAQAYNISNNDVLMAFAVAGGADPGDAYSITHPEHKNLTNEQGTAYFNSILENSPGIKLLITKIKAGKNKNFVKNEELNEIRRGKIDADEYRTREGLITKIIDNVSRINGKDAVSALQTLAKMQGFDKIEEQEADERRTFFIPWVSSCRSCKLMKIYRDIDF